MPSSGYSPEDPFAVTLHSERLNEPLKWMKPKMVFVCSMGDIFHEDVPFEFIARIFSVMALNERHIFQILTKRPERMAEFLKWVEACYARMFENDEGLRVLPNVWLGVTAENQEQADKRIPILLDIPAAKRFVSIEPMLGEIDIKPYIGLRSLKCKCGYHSDEMDLVPRGLSRGKENLICLECGYRAEEGPVLDWVICGGETGQNARPMNPEWARSVRDQCKEAGVPFFFKQWGEWGLNEWTNGMFPALEEYRGTMRAFTIVDHSNRTEIGKTTYNVFPLVGNSYETLTRVGKKKAGCLLDGVEHKEFPLDPRLREDDKEGAGR